MTSITYEIDPGGDVELVLEFPNKQQIVPIIKHKDYENYRVPKFDGDSDHVFDNPSLVGRYAVFNIEEEIKEEDHAMDEDGQETKTADSRSDELIEVRMRVSSRHLILASRTFRTMLEGPWSENLSRASQSQSGPVQIKTTDWNAAALVIVLDAIHGRYQGIPKHVDLGLITRIATIVDYYECHECLQLISDIWMADVCEEYKLPDTFCKSSLLWLYISSVFSKRDIMDPISRVILQETQGLSRINLKDLPLGQILVKIDGTRQKLIGKFITDLGALRMTLSVESGCPGRSDPACSALVLGILIRGQQNLGLLSPSPVAPYRDYSLNHLYSGAKGFPITKLGYDRCTCTIDRRLGPILDKLLEDMNCYDLIA